MVASVFKRIVYFVKIAGLLATVKENLFRVYPLWRVEPTLHEEEGHTRKNRVPKLFVSVNRKTRTHINTYFLLVKKRNVSSARV